MLWQSLQVLGLICLIIAVLTHVAEKEHLISSPGHYLDLVGAIFGCALVTLGFAGENIER
jgi:hypothetical protein